MLIKCCRCAKQRIEAVSVGGWPLLLLIAGVVLLPAAAVVEGISNNHVAVGGSAPSLMMEQLLSVVATGGQDVTAPSAADDVVVDVVTRDLGRPLAAQSAGRKGKALHFFPTGNEDADDDVPSANRIDAQQRQQQQQHYIVTGSYEATGNEVQNDNEPFTFPQAMRPAAQYQHNGQFGAFATRPQQQQLQQQQQQQQSNDVIYGNAQTYNVPRPPPQSPNYYAQNYNYAGQSSQPLYSRPQSQQRPPPNYSHYQTGHAAQRPQFPSAYRPPPNNYVQRPPTNYASTYNMYHPQSTAATDDGSISLTSIISNLGQTASDFFSGGAPRPQYPTYATAANQPQNPAAAGAAANPLNRFGKALEEITRHDDLQCIPKIICQMVGAQRRQNVQGSLLGSPVFTSLISAVPSTSTGLVYGRAALLGYTAGEDRCAGAYPKCPRNEDNLLYYLNNHRGGFFRFFNGGAAFGDTNGLYTPAAPAHIYNSPQETQYAQKYPLYSHNNYDQKPQPQQHQQQQQHQAQYQQQQQLQDSTNTNLAFLTGLADAINQSGGINLSNLGANAGLIGNLASLVGGMTGLGGADSSASESQQSSATSGVFNVGEMFSNLLTGFVGNRFSSRRIKRSLTEDEQEVEMTTTSMSMMNTTTADLDPLLTLEKESKYVKETASKKRNLNTEMKAAAESEVSDSGESKADDLDIEEILAEDDDDDEENNVADASPEGRILSGTENVIEEPEGRILNRKPSRFQLHLNTVNFPAQNPTRFEKKIKFQPNYAHPNAVATNDDDVFVFQTNYVATNPTTVPDSIRFPDHSNLNTPRWPKKVSFDEAFRPQRPAALIDYDLPDHRIKMVFPDRTGTGNLKFDSIDFERSTAAPLPAALHRFGKILFGQQQQPSSVQQGQQFHYTVQQLQRPQHRPDEQLLNYVTPQPAYQNPYEHQHQTQYEDYTRYPPLNRAGSIDYNRPPTRRKNQHQQSQEDSSQNVYVTNGKGVVEYYINAAGKKVYV